MRSLTFALVVVFALLQYALWFSKGGVISSISLRRDIHVQAKKDEQLKQRNEKILAAIHALKSGNASVEAHAREDLGMVKKDEQYFEVAS